MSDLATQIRSAIAEHKIMLFMKGTPDSPQCGFSAAVVDVLKQYGKPFASWDILEHPAIREELSRQSSWPTVPQLFINGEFVGGCDIVREMHARGEIQPLIDRAFAEEQAATG